MKTASNYALQRIAARWRLCESRRAPFGRLAPGAGHDYLWEIALFFRALTQGCQIERLRLETAHPLPNAFAISLIIAWRLPTITMLGRAHPEASGEVVFEPHEWPRIYLMQGHSPPPDQPPPLRDTVRALAQWGGFLARTRDGEPGITAIWQGYQRLHEVLYAVETHLAVNGS